MAYNSKFTGAQVEALLDRAGAAPQTYDIGWILDIIDGIDPNSAYSAALTKEQWDEVKAAADAGKVFTHDGAIWSCGQKSHSYVGVTYDVMEFFTPIMSSVYYSTLEGYIVELKRFYVERITSSSEGTSYVVSIYSSYMLVTTDALGTFAKTTDIPTKTSQLTNDSGFITADDVALSGKTVVKTNENSIGYGNGYTIITPSIELAADKFHVVGRCQGLTLTLPDGADMDGQEYCCQFYVGTSSFTLTLPASVYWQNGEAPEFASSTCCQLVIVNNCATIGVFKASS